jgi:hypothetical protein
VKGRPKGRPFSCHDLRELQRAKLTLTVLSFTAGLTGGAAAVAAPVAIPPVPHIVVDLGATIAPKKLPASRFAPVNWHVFAKVATSDGTHPPALREIELDVDKDLRLNAGGYPVCAAGRAIRRDSKGALKACRDALLGEGRAHIEIASPEGPPALLATRLLVFNGVGKGATPRLLIHGFLTEPAPTALVVSVTLQKRAGGLHTVATLPPIANGLGSVVDFELDIGATYLQGKRRIGYFEAKCPDGVFKVNVKKMVFRNEAQTRGEAATTQLKGSLAVPCTPKG